MATKMENRVGMNFAIFRCNPWRQFIELLEICCKDTNIHEVWKTKFPIFWLQQCGCALSKDSDQPGIRPVWSESSLRAQWLAKDPSFLYVDSEDFDQTGRMPRLIWVFAGSTVILLVLSWGGSNSDPRDGIFYLHLTPM